MILTCIEIYLLIGVILLVITMYKTAREKGCIDISDGWINPLVLFPLLIVLWLPAIIFGIYRPFA